MTTLLLAVVTNPDGSVQRTPLGTIAHNMQAPEVLAELNGLPDKPENVRFETEPMREIHHPDYTLSVLRTPLEAFGIHVPATTVLAA